MYGSRVFHWLEKQFKKFLYIALIIMACFIIIFSITVIIAIIYIIYSCIKGVNLSSSTGISDLDTLFKFCSYFITILGLSSLIFTALTYIRSQQNHLKEEKSQKLIRSVNVIKAFDNKIIKQMEQSEQDVLNRKNLSQDKDNILKSTHKFTTNQIKHISLNDLPQKTQNVILSDNKFNNVIDTINNIEQWSLYLDNDMVYYDLVYRETHYDFTDFIGKFYDVLKEASSQSDRYKACHDVYEKMRKSEQHEIN